MRTRIYGGVAAAFIVLLCGVAVLYFTGHLLPHRAAAQYSIVLQDDGFHPQDVTIRRGDTIVFSSTTKEPFWPASNPHPIHSDHPLFDPQRPIQVGETWSYTFNTAGVWGFHNHLNSPTKGTITVMP